jgi:glucose-6-phosphate isomerase
VKLALGAQQDAVQRRITALTSAEAGARIWSRDEAFWGGDVARQASVSNRLGWLDIASKMRPHADEIAAFAQEVRDAGFRDAVLLGMGGSSLAPEVLRQSIAEMQRASGLTLHVLDTTDPATIAAVTAAIDPELTLFFVSSKSGGTIEPNSLFAYFHEIVSGRKGERAGENFVAITDAGTSLQALAAQHHFRRVFTNPGDIGGRYSALSYFGLVPAAVAGVDVARLLDRGIAEEQCTGLTDSDALNLGAALGEMALAGRNACTFLVSPEIASFGLWLEQLIAESTGKEGKGILPIAGEPVGSPLQYAQDRVFVQLRLEAGSNGDNDATIGALTAEGFPAIVIDLGDVYDLGAQFMRWEYAIAVAGHVLGINPFDEPNVQESKDNTNRVLAEFEASGRLDIDAITGSEARPVAITGAGHTAEGGLAYALSELLADAGEGAYVAITAYVRATEGMDEAFGSIRELIRNARPVATTLGYGPRFLHSTGQLHKGGPPAGIFLQVTADDEQDLAVPGKPYTFGQLKRAQAIGDFQSIVAHGRPVLRVHLGADVEAGVQALRDAVSVAVERDRVAGR